MAQKKKARKEKPVKKEAPKALSKAPPKEAEKKKPKEVPQEVPKETVPKEVPKETRAENVVLIGRKPVMNYVLACITFFNSGEKEVTVKARGQAISRAVDTIELLRRAFVKDLEVTNINIGTEEMQREEGGARNVSTLEITVTKAGSK